MTRIRNILVDLQNKATSTATVIEETYIKMDAIGRRSDGVDYNDKDTLIVMSDHGFASFRRGFNLNTWLHRNGYITRHDSTIGEDGEECSSIRPPFRRCRLDEVESVRNRAERIVFESAGSRKKWDRHDGAEKAALLRTLTDQLLAVRDTDGSKVIDKIYNTAADYVNADPDIAPDLLIGYARNYRAGWPTLLGGFSEDIIEDNKDRWSGDHCIAAHLVPGILLSNKPITTEDPDLRDLAPTLLSVFRIGSTHGA